MFGSEKFKEITIQCQVCRNERKILASQLPYKVNPNTPKFFMKCPKCGKETEHRIIR
jgi:ribosomal protein L33